MNDIALAAIVLVWAAVPASLLLLIFVEAIKLEGEERYKRWTRGCLLALSPPLLLIFGSLAWGWAGAAHLEPLCSAYAEPEFRQTRITAPAVVRIDSDQTTMDGVPPAWASSLLAPIGPFEEIRVGNTDEASLLLQVRRSTHHRSRLFHVQMDRFTLRDARFGSTLAVADELWIDAGRARYHCGIGSGRYPTSTTDYPAGDGVAQFLTRALRGKPARP